ncbi:MAG: glutamate racemase [Anaerolineae bacterium]
MNNQQDGIIGVFDSGVGGLSVVRALCTRMPEESILYVADSANCPYGAKDAAEIIRLSTGISRFLIGNGAKMIVVACNTASAAALSQLRASFPAIPFVGMVPAVKPAAQVTQSGVVGVLATPGTLHGKLYEDVVAQFTSGMRVLSVACPGLVELIEAGEVEGPLVEPLLHSCIDPLLQAGVDTLVLGCTHYPFLIPVLERLYSPSLRILEPSDAVARQAERVLVQHDLRIVIRPTVKHVFYSTGPGKGLELALSRFLHISEPVGQLQWKDNDLYEGESHAQLG